MDLSQHETVESATLNVIHKNKNWDIRRNVHYRILPSITWRQLRRRPAHFSLCTFLPLLSPTKLNLPNKQSCNNVWQEPQTETAAPYPLKKQLRARRSALVVGSQRDTAFCGSLRAVFAQPAPQWCKRAARSRCSSPSCCWTSAGAWHVPRPSPLHGSDTHTQYVRTTELHQPGMVQHSCSVPLPHQSILPF